MFAAIGRFFRAIGYLFTGKVDSATKDLSKDPHVVSATYSKIIEEKKKRIHQYKEAVSGLIAQEEKKLATMKTLQADVKKLSSMREGAAAKAKKIVTALKAAGKSQEVIKHDAEYQKCLAAYHDFTHTIAEKNDRIDELDDDVGNYAENIKDHKVQLQALLREVDKLKSESREAVADVITSQEEKELADMVSGISEDRYSKELEQMRELRSEMRAEARVSRELAGTDTARQEAEFLEYARTSASSDEFDTLIGLAEEADLDAGPAVEEAEGSKLPEN